MINDAIMAAVITVGILLTLGVLLTVVIVASILRAALRHRRDRPDVHEQAGVAREVDDLELLYGMPAYDPAWNAGFDRLWDAVRDEQQKGDTL
ncbi:hypothetical protein [Streptomyces scabiei]|uniref:hypothetical protein n=1 Tax=Streptomyces scabiei TaxID=1930 RepID=UPI0029A0B88F|nr:hypothetical protein [Streptomyces scabiei]MDX3520767.1 hypothetical protein [Streptomyces scabiei]